MGIGEQELRAFLLERLALLGGVGVDEVDPDRLIEQYGVSSRDAVAMTGELAEFLDRPLRPESLWRYPTVNQMVRGLIAEGREIAVVGLARRAGRADGYDADFFGTSAGRAFGTPSDRSSSDRAVGTPGDPSFSAPGGGTFGALDDRATELLEVEWEALESAGVAPRSVERVGEFVDASPLVAAHEAVQSLRGGKSDIALATAVGDGRAVVVLKRLPDAERDGNRVIAQLSGSAPDGLVAACADAGVMLTEIDQPQTTTGFDGLLKTIAQGNRLTAVSDDTNTHVIVRRGRQSLANQPLQRVGHFLLSDLTLDRIREYAGALADHLDPTAEARTANAPTAEPSAPLTSAGVAPADIAATRVAPGDIASADIAAADVAPAGVAPADVAAAGVTPADIAAADIAAAGVAPADIASADIAPAGVASADIASTGVAAADVALADVARTLAGRLGRGPVRAAVVARDRGELLEGLRALAEGQNHPAVVTGEVTHLRMNPVWVFPGDKPKWTSLRSLVEAEPDFAATVNELDPLLRWSCGLPFQDAVLTGSRPDERQLKSALFGVQVALALLWRQYGVTPAAIVGNATGEIAGAVLAGALTVTEGARIVAGQTAQRRAPQLPFYESAKAAARAGHRVFTEISLHPQLTDELEADLVTSTLRQDQDPVIAFHLQLATLEVNGLPLTTRPGRIIDLPPSPWRRR